MWCNVCICGVSWVMWELKYREIASEKKLEKVTQIVVCFKNATFSSVKKGKEYKNTSYEILRVGERIKRKIKKTLFSLFLHSFPPSDIIILLSCSPSSCSSSFFFARAQKKYKKFGEKCMELSCNRYLRGMKPRWETQSSRESKGYRCVCRYASFSHAKLFPLASLLFSPTLDGYISCSRLRSWRMCTHANIQSQQVRCTHWEKQSFSVQVCVCMCGWWRASTFFYLNTRLGSDKR